MWIGKKPLIQEIQINNISCHLVSELKALGIYFQGDLCWDSQAEHALNKARKLLTCFKHLRKYMTEEQFLKAVTVNYYRAVFYASSVWFQSTKKVYKIKFDSIHFRILRTATHQYEVSRSILTERCKRATPSEWVNFSTASLVMKTIRNVEPKPLFNLLQNNYFEESRKPQVGYFFELE